LIAGCRTVSVGWWLATGELGGGVFGFPSLSFSDGVQQQHRPGWHVGVGGCGAFPHVRTALGAVRGLNASCFEKLPNELTIAHNAIEAHMQRAAEAREAIAKVIQYEPKVQPFYADAEAITSRADEIIKLLTEARKRQS
jgi:hypothetical protein